MENPEQFEDFYEKYWEQHWVTKEAQSESEVVEEPNLYLDKIYFFLHLTFIRWEGRNIWPYHFLEEGGTDIGEVEFGNCPVRAFSPQQLEEIAQMLEQVTKSELEASYISNYGTDDGFEWLFELFDKLKAFVARSVKAGKNVLLTIG